MLDILMPISASNVEQAIQCIDSLCEHTDVPFRIIAVVDGGVRQDIGELEARLKGGDEQFKWVLHQTSATVYFNEALLLAMNEIKNQWVALVPPEVSIVDPQWFGKLQVVFTKDPICYMVDGVPDTKAAAMIPMKRGRHHPARDCRFFLSTKISMGNLKEIPAHTSDVVNWMQRESLRQGGTVWCAQGVRFHITEHEEHLACYGQSAEAAPSE